MLLKSLATSNCNTDLVGHQSSLGSYEEHKATFTQVAANSEHMNDIMSTGIYRAWKDKLIRTLKPTSKTLLLDAAGGNGDIARRFLNYLDASGDSKGGQKVTVCDENENILKEGRKYAEKNHLNIDWEHCGLEALTFDDKTFNAYTIAFAMRNSGDKNRVLQEAYRVLKPGGRFLCLEFSHLQNPILRNMYRSQSSETPLGDDTTPQEELDGSIARFPKQEDFADMIRGVGFKAVTYENISFGICAIHSGFKI